MTKLLTCYTFANFSEKIKNKIRDRERYRDVEHDDWWEYICDDAVKCARLMGITIAQRSVRRPAPMIYFSGFSSQGDGASFEGLWAYAENSVADVIAHAPNDVELLRIAQGLAVIQTAALLGCGNRMHASITTRGGYCHSGTIDVDCRYTTDNPICDDPVDDDIEKEVTQLMRDFADWIYGQLRAEHDYLTSDEHIDEYLAENTYDEDGNEQL